MNLKNNAVRRRQAKLAAAEQRKRDNGRALYWQEQHRRAKAEWKEVKK